MWSIYTVSLLHIAFFIVIIMALHSTLHDFPGKDWLSYQERFGFYFQANYIDYSAAIKQQEILLSVIGTDTYTLLHSLAAHCTLLAIISSQNQTPYYNGTHSILHFARESIYQWICGSFKGFGKDMWIWYIIWHYIYTADHTRGEFAWQTRLWRCWSSDTAPSEMKLTFEKALPIALVMESASNIAQLHSSHGMPSTQSDVNKLSLASGKHSYHKQPQKHKHVYVCVLVTQVIFDALHICIGKIGVVIPHVISSSSFVIIVHQRDSWKGPPAMTV